MKRLELFEFEDFAWFPKAIRTGGTNLIMVLHKMVGTQAVLANLILELKTKTDFKQVTDMGAGAGGAMIETIKLVNQKLAETNTPPVQLLLSDLFPHPNTIAEINASGLPNIKYHPQPVDATKVGTAPDGLKTMIASFHHMSPPNAKKILASAQESGSSILIYEIAKNNIPFIIWLLLLPLSLVVLMIMSLLMTPFVRPLTFGQLFFTYIIPLIPITYAWDGQMSIMRTYTFEDIKTLLPDSENSNYTWSVGDAKNAKGKNAGYFIIGQPK